MLSAKRLRQVMRYDPKTGVFFRLITISNAKAGSIAGSIQSTGGNRRTPRKKVWIDGKKYLCSRLAYLYMRGKWPRNEIDHVDSNTLNDRWRNLRPATRKQNANYVDWSRRSK